MMIVDIGGGGGGGAHFGMFSPGAMRHIGVDM